MVTEFPAASATTASAAMRVIVQAVTVAIVNVVLLLTDPVTVILCPAMNQAVRKPLALSVIVSGLLFTKAIVVCAAIPVPVGTVLGSE